MTPRERADACPECEAPFAREEHYTAESRAEVNGETVDDWHYSAWTLTCENGHHWKVWGRWNVSPRWVLEGRAAESAFAGAPAPPAPR